MKTYVITLSKTFPAWHPRKGQPTEFLEKFLNGQTKPIDWTGADPSIKLHTIRANFPLWLKRIQDVRNGKAVLSVRQWSGRPYASKQVTVATLSTLNFVGIQQLNISEFYGVDRYTVWDMQGYNGYDVNPGVLAAHDGLSLDDWLSWFKDYKRGEPLAIIHFTIFRY